MGSSGAAAFFTAPLSIRAAQNQGQARANQLRGEARLAELRAQERLRQGSNDIESFKKKSKVQLGESISNYAKAGVDLSASPMMVLSNSKREMNLAMNEISRQALNEADLLRQNAMQLRSAANKAKRSGLEAGILNSMGTILSKSDFSEGSSKS